MCRWEKVEQLIRIVIKKKAWRGLWCFIKMKFHFWFRSHCIQILLTNETFESTCLLKPYAIVNGLRLHQKLVHILHFISRFLSQSSSPHKATQTQTHIHFMSESRESKRKNEKEQRQTYARHRHRLFNCLHRLTHCIHTFRMRASSQCDQINPFKIHNDRRRQTHGLKYYDEIYKKKAISPLVRRTRIVYGALYLCGFLLTKTTTTTTTMTIPNDECLVRSVDAQTLMVMSLNKAIEALARKWRNKRPNFILIYVTRIWAQRSTNLIFLIPSYFQAFDFDTIHKSFWSGWLFRANKMHCI